MANGITLIALVVTIIVLLILAGISIQMLTGDNGIIQRANDTKEKTEISEIEEELKLITAEVQTEYHKNMNANKTKLFIDELTNTEKRNYIKEATVLSENPIKGIIIGKKSKKYRYNVDFDNGTVNVTNKGNSYDVIYDGNGAQEGSTQAQIDLEKGASIQISENGYKAPEGKEFNGWKDSDGNSYIVGQSYTITKDLILIAQWKLVSYTLNVQLKTTTTTRVSSADDSILEIILENGDILNRMASYDNPVIISEKYGDLDKYATAYTIKIPTNATLHFYCSSGRKRLWWAPGVKYTSRTHLYYNITGGSGTYNVGQANGDWGSDHDWFRSTWITDAFDGTTPPYTVRES